MRDDLISRREAIDALAVYIRNVDRVYSTGKLSADDCKDAAKSVLDELPSEQPEIIRCKDCANYDTDWTPETVPDRHYCLVMDGMMPKDGFCNFAERRTDERSD